MTQDFDIVIVGGGMVGASLVCALPEGAYRIALVEAYPFGDQEQPSYDERTVALAYGSKQIYENMALWSEIEPFATPIRHIHVSERGRFGATRFSHRELGLDALGYVVENQALGKCLYARISQLENVRSFVPARFCGYHIETNGLTVTVDHRSEGGQCNSLHLRCRLLIAADGNSSEVRKQAGIKVRRTGYGQTAIVANVSVEREHEYTAYERFTDTGPVALLPMRGRRCSLVWSNADQDIDAVMALSDTDFLHRLQDRFGYRLGHFTRVGVRQSYPLSLMRARELVSGRIALLGNSAHSLHPVAGQGLNLALRDVAVLAYLLAEHDGLDVGDERVLRSFARCRHHDFNNTILFTDGLARLFTNPLLGAVNIRGMGLLLMDIIPPLRKIFARYGMGISNHLPLQVAAYRMVNYSRQHKLRSRFGERLS